MAKRKKRKNGHAQPKRQSFVPRGIVLATSTQRREIARLVDEIGDETLRAETEVELRTMTIDVARFYIDELLTRSAAKRADTPTQASTGPNR